VTAYPYISDPFTPAVPATPPQRPSASNAPDTDKREAFDLLRTVVTDLEASGRKTLLAGIKPEMQRRTEGRFSEAALGFDSFRAFAEAAVSASYVTATDDGQSFVLHSDGVKTKSPSRLRRSEPGSKRRRPVRPDLWKAFVDWDPTLGRAWDKQEEAALMFGLESEGEDAETQEHRKSIESQPDRFVAIPRIHFETQLAWMREFSESLSEKRHGRLLISILNGDDRPANAFMNYLRANNQLSPEWNMFKTARVRSVIESWIRKNNLGPEVLEAASGQAENGKAKVPAAQSAGQAEADGAQDEERIRKLVLAAVSRMPLADLLRLQIPVEYMVELG